MLWDAFWGCTMAHIRSYNLIMTGQSWSPLPTQPADRPEWVVLVDESSKLNGQVPISRNLSRIFCRTRAYMHLLISCQSLVRHSRSGHSGHPVRRKRHAAFRQSMMPISSHRQKDPVVDLSLTHCFEFVFSRSGHVWTRRPLRRGEGLPSDSETNRIREDPTLYGWSWRMICLLDLLLSRNNIADPFTQSVMLRLHTWAINKFLIETRMVSRTRSGLRPTPGLSATWPQISITSYIPCCEP
jgi:hypothetical protein